MTAHERRRVDPVPESLVDFEVQVGASGVAGAANTSNHGAGPDPGANSSALGHQVHVDGLGAITVIDGDCVASTIGPAAQDHGAGVHSPDGRA